jgi:hypothetical protein
MGFGIFALVFLIALPVALIYGMVASLRKYNQTQQTGWLASSLVLFLVTAALVFGSMFALWWVVGIEY